MSNYLGFEPTKDKNYYFISYNSEDIERIIPIVKKIAGCGVPLWYDYGLEYGEKWEAQISGHIKEAKALLLFLTKGVLQKPESYVRKEYNIATNFYKRTTYVVYLDAIDNDDVPFSVVPWWVDIKERQGIEVSALKNPDDIVEKIVIAIQSSDGIQLGSHKVAEMNIGGREVPEKVKTNKIVHNTVKVSSREEEKINNDAKSENVQTAEVGKPIVENKKIVFKNGDIYEGDFVDGARTGKGKLILSNGKIYEGDFVDGELTGKGKYTWPDGDTYEGDFVDGKRTGQGKYTWSDGDIYEGDFVDGERTGQGKLSCPNGNIYEGDFVDGTPHGKGRYSWSDGCSFEGTVDMGRLREGKWEGSLSKRTLHYLATGTIKFL